MIVRDQNNKDGCTLSREQLFYVFLQRHKPEIDNNDLNKENG